MRCCHVFSCSATSSRFRLECDATAVSQPGSATTSFRKLQRGAVTFSLRSRAGHASCRPVVGKDTSHDSLAGRPGTAANRCKRAVSIAPAQVPRSLQAELWNGQRIPWTAPAANELLYWRNTWPPECTGISWMPLTSMDFMPLVG